MEPKIVSIEGDNSCEQDNDNYEEETNEIEVTNSTYEQTPNIANNNVNSSMSKKSKIIIGIIVSVIAVIFIVHEAYVLHVNNNTIATKDIKYIISTFDSNVLAVEENFKSQKDGNGRTIGVFTYKTYPYNLYGQTVTREFYTSTITVMFMKKNGTVEYAICPDNWLVQSTYEDFEDFKAKNNWGKAESLGLGSNSKTFQSK